MKSLIKIMLILGLGFAATFVVMKLLGILSIEQISAWLNQASELAPHYLIGLVISLLLLDLFIAMPTLTIIILGGYFLGFYQGMLAGATGLLLAGMVGYGLSRWLGQSFVALIIRDQAKRDEMLTSFSDYGAIIILLSRAMPILPEVSACMAGLNKMPWLRFIAIWSLSALPYAAIAAYAGSISSLQDPKPAIFTAVGLSCFFWCAWYAFMRKNKAQIKPSET